MIFSLSFSLFRISRNQTCCLLPVVNGKCVRKAYSILSNRKEGGWRTLCTLQLLLDYSQLPLVKCRMRYTCFNFFFILKFAATLAEGNVLVYGTKELDESKIYHVDIFTKHRSRWSGISNLFPCSIGRI